MIDAKVLATGLKGDEPISVWSVWIPRSGDNVTFTLEVAANYGTVLTAELYQKNYDEVGDGTATGSSTVFGGSTGRQAFTKLGAKELVRVRLTLEPEAALEDEVGWVVLRFLQPVWFESVKV